MEYRFGAVTVAYTNVDRVVFPADGIAKGEVLAYYRDVAPLMLPELAGRPLTVVRYTKDIARGGFYQKHYQKHFPPWLGRVAVAGKTPVEYPVIDDEAGIVYLANQGALEFHVWTSRRDALHRPDVLVFDLDPPEGRFDLVRRAAHEVRALCDQLGLPAFVKTTGSKGLHVVAPLDGAAAFDDTGALGAQMAARLCRRNPELLTTEFYKKDRGGRLFVDVLRNAYSATLVAPYSLRGRPGAPVSAPIAWAEVDDPALAADGIRLSDVRARLERGGDPWHALRQRAGSVTTAAHALARLAGVT